MTTATNVAQMAAAQSIILSVKQASACFRLARTLLRGEQGRETDSIPAVAFETIELTIHCGGRLRATGRGRGATLARAIRRAVIAVLADMRLGKPLSAQSILEGRLGLWIQYAAEPIVDGCRLDLGVDGVELRNGIYRAGFDPSVALTAGLPRVELLLNQLAGKVGLAPDAWREAGVGITRTRWEHYAEGTGGPVSALRLRRLRPAERGESLARSDIVDAAMLAAQRLIVSQQADGYYAYLRHPFIPTKSRGPGNLVRQAGCAFAVAWASQAFADSVDTTACVESAGRVIASLLAMAVNRPGGALILVEPEAKQGKLGLSALTLATLQCRPLADRYSREREAMLAGVLAMQRGDGSFRCLEHNDLARFDGRKQDYFPGEALVALCRELQSGSRIPRPAIEKAFAWHRAYFRSNPNTAFVPWHAQAWRMFADWISENSDRSCTAHEYSAFVFEIVDWLLRFQRIEAGDRPDFLGGFSAAGGEPGASTASYAEAIVHAYSLARRLGLEAQCERYRRAALLAIGFLFRLRIPSEVAFLFSKPIKVVGATPRSLSDMTLRCDADQHTLTALLTALEAPGLFED